MPILCVTGFNIEEMNKYFPISEFDRVYLIDLCEPYVVLTFSFSFSVLTSPVPYCSVIRILLISGSLLRSHDRPPPRLAPCIQMSTR